MSCLNIHRVLWIFLDISRGECVKCKKFFFVELKYSRARKMFFELYSGIFRGENENRDVMIIVINFTDSEHEIK